MKYIHIPVPPWLNAVLICAVFFSDHRLPEGRDAAESKVRTQPFIGWKNQSTDMMNRLM